MSSIAEDIKQNRPFRTAAEMAFVSLLRTADQVAAREETFLKNYGVTLTQYNVLRILRGAGPDGLPCGEIGRRMITRVPDVTRLLDRMEAQGLVIRQRSTEDRRRVAATLTARGVELTNRIDEPSAQFHADHLGRLGGEKLRTLVSILDEIRGL